MLIGCMVTMMTREYDDKGRVWYGQECTRREGKCIALHCTVPEALRGRISLSPWPT